MVRESTHELLDGKEELSRRDGESVSVWRRAEEMLNISGRLPFTQKA